MRLAEADCFAPGQLDSLRALSSSQRAVSGKEAAPVEKPGMMSEGSVIWLDDQGLETAAPRGVSSSQNLPGINLSQDLGFAKGFSCHPLTSELLIYASFNQNPCAI